MSIIEGLSASQQAKHREIAVRYGKRSRARKVRYPIAALRVGELKRLAMFWWGAVLPECDECSVFVRVVANHLASLSGDPTDRITKFIETRAPWLSEDEVDEIVDLADQSPTHYSADSVARAVGLDYATRQRLRIKTIGAVDCLKAERKRLRTSANARAEAARRLKRGVKPRLRNISEERPWEDFFVSRSTYYRHREAYDRLLASELGGEL